MRVKTPHGVPLSWLAGLMLLAGCSPLDAGRVQAPAGVQNNSGLTDKVVLVDLEDRPVSPFDVPGARAFVFLFVRTDCPVSNRYAPEIQRLFRSYAGRNVAFRLVYPDPGDSAGAVQAHQKEYHLTVPALRDPHHALVRRAGARVTPEAAVFVPGRGEVYRGRIDDRYVDFGKERPASTQHDLADALDRILQGKPLTNSTTVAVGCYISERP